MSEEYSEYAVYQFVREAVKRNPKFMDAAIRGAVSGHQDAMDALKEHLSWANMATDMALHMAMGKRVTQGTKDIAEHVIRQRFLSMKGSLNGIETEFLEKSE